MRRQSYHYIYAIAARMRGHLKIQQPRSSLALVQAESDEEKGRKDEETTQQK